VTQTPAPPGLATPLQFIKGVGPRRAEQLGRKELRTVEDALFFLPLRHEDRTRLTPFHSLQPGQAYTCEGTIVGISPPPPGRSRAPFSAMLRDASGYATASWFNAGYLARVFTRGQRLVLHGKVGRYKGALVIQQPDWEIVESGEDDRLHTGRLVPVYSLTEGLPQRALRSLMWRVVDQFARDVPEALPDAVLRRRGLVGLARALGDAHFPETDAGLAAARRRLAFDDFLLLQLGLAILRSRTARARGIAMNPRGDLVRRLHASLPYTLTVAQERVWEEIRRDMAAPYPMHRLLQGDVGSGKTIVAALAVLTAIEAGYQAAVMAPTEILAEQHVMTFRQLLEPLGVGVTLLTSSVKPRESAARRAALAAGEVPCVVGTHALVQGGVEFRRLGLAVVDEQHRFGVEQRAKLRGKGEHPDLLVMTATPIPRTLALTLYGDLDVSVLDELPPGRRPVVTVARAESKRRGIYKFLRDEIAGGRQAYVVYPLIEESEALDLKAATDMAKHLAEDVFPDLTLGLMHGRLGFEEKDAIMRRFKAGEIQILVATTVIEVGIDVPNATVMLVEHAERFGLSQLHQLRGRVGRGPWKSYCVLLTSGRLTEEAQRRIDGMTATNDGFKIAEVDLELRGPGEFFGTRQSGLPEFRVADLLRDAAILEEARQEAATIVARDPELGDPAHRALRAGLLARWRGKLALASAG
jgi:ATP-dependent DNA helicase RecG